VKGQSTLVIRPKKSLGQNFLRDENIARKIIAAIDPQPADVMLEIGPGGGALTKYLAPLVRMLIAVDVDKRVIERMREVFPDGSIQLLHHDVLEIDLQYLARQHGQRLRIVGNIPYNITSPILFHVLDNRSSVHDAVFMMQREVARRLVAVPHTKEYGILSVFCQLFTNVQLLFDVSPHAFFPRPEVTSSLVRLTVLGEPRYSKKEKDAPQFTFVCGK
jgi:16S rRNA (adenine1518-N6/adenine1519-N6)-dimethyltransferase